MKKRYLLLLILAISVFVFSACGTDANADANTVAKTVTDEDLDTATALIKSAEEELVNCSSLQLDRWDSYYYNYFFDDETYMLAKDVSDHLYNGVNMAHEYRTNAKSKLDQARELLGSTSTGAYYDAVKEYYKTVNKYLTFTSTFPEGYNKLTYISTIADYKTDCQDAYSEIEFSK